MVKISPLYFLVIVFLTLISCQTQHVDFSKITQNEICALKDNIELIGNIESLSVTDSMYVVSTGDHIIIFNSVGEQETIIDRKGRGRYEYVDASIVRQYDDCLYVWCPYLLKFIVFDSNGNGIRECQYNSAISDFIPHGDNVYIYTRGLREDHIIDVLNFSSGEVLDSLVNTSSGHRALLSQTSKSPIDIEGKSLYFMPKDSLVVYRYNIDSSKLDRVMEFCSDSFVSSPFKNQSIDKNLSESIEYVFHNSYTTGLSVKDGHCYVLTAEGTADIQKDYTMRNNTLYSNLYNVDMSTGDAIQAKSDKPLDTPRISSYNGSLFYVLHEINDSTDVYTLNRLSIP